MYIINNIFLIIICFITVGMFLGPLIFIIEFKIKFSVILGSIVFVSYSIYIYLIVELLLYICSKLPESYFNE